MIEVTVTQIAYREHLEAHPTSVTFTDGPGVGWTIALDKDGAVDSESAPLVVGRRYRLQLVAL